MGLRCISCRCQSMAKACLCGTAGSSPTKPKSSPSLHLLVFSHFSSSSLSYYFISPSYFLFFISYIYICFLAGLQQIFWQKCCKNVSEMRSNLVGPPLSTYPHISRAPFLPLLLTKSPQSPYQKWGSCLP